MTTPLMLLYDAFCMKSLMKLFPLAFVVLACGVAVQAEELHAGWEKVLWGMKEEEITKVYPAVQRLPKPADYNFNGRKYVASFMLPDVMLADAPFNALFLMDGDGNLACVQLERDMTNAEDTVTLFAKLQEQLRTKHAAPREVEELAGKDTLFGKESKIETWIGDKARLDLRCITVPAARAFRVSLAYQKPLSKQEK